MSRPRATWLWPGAASLARAWLCWGIALGGASCARPVPQAGDPATRAAAPRTAAAAERPTPDASPGPGGRAPRANGAAPARLPAAATATSPAPRPTAAAAAAPAAATAPAAAVGPAAPAAAPALLADAAAWASLTRQRAMLGVSAQPAGAALRVTVASADAPLAVAALITTADGQVLLPDAVDLDEALPALEAARDWARCLDEADVTLYAPAASPQRALLGAAGAPLWVDCDAAADPAREAAAPGPGSGAAAPRPRDARGPCAALRPGAPGFWHIGAIRYPAPRDRAWLEAKTLCKAPTSPPPPSPPPLRAP